ncbi:phosphotransferase [Aureimonas leprariae]|uniref:Maltokinase n=1 Tax=Plantimonas leprariae TaxID=2615207 RepID=A0A7V7PNK3_9HYPH|nr:phosphotransferase [Aureimonas leprariae]KAB0679270.1 hypothetical protein F6X38_13080 [Aureimonas leprariae]
MSQPGSLPHDQSPADASASFADADVAAFVAQQRWFAAKSGASNGAGTTVLGTLPGHPDYVLAESRLDTVDGRQSYFLPLSSGGTAADPSHRVAGGAVDGARDGALVAAFVALLTETRDLPLDGGAALRVEVSEAAKDLAAAAREIAPEHIRPISGEQSNTSILVGPVAILKLYRRLRDGIQPELEVTRFLTERTQFRAAPALLGSAVLRRGDGTEAAVAALFERVENRGDAWAVVLDELVLELHGETPANRFDAGPVLGRRTGEMHAGLATRTGDPAFEPEPIDAARLDGFVAGARHETEEALAVLERVRPNLAEADRADVDRLIDAKARIGAFFDSFRDMKVASFATRIHGDYHLGQVLVSAAGDVTILDFEGEPGASLEERRAKFSALRDVAGMLRSFDYAAFAALDRIGGEEAVRFRAAATDWRDRTSAAFLEAWQAASGIDLADEANGRLLDLFTLQKALYELRYEAAMRPAWLSIPLRGITALLEKRQVLA